MSHVVGRPRLWARRRPREHEPAHERRRATELGAAAAAGAGAGVKALARLVLAAAGLVVLLILLAVLLRDIGANPHNSIVRGVHDGAHFFARPFDAMFTYSGVHPKRQVTVNWGVAAAAYALLGGLVAAAIATLGRRGLRLSRRRAPTPA
jgi:hypothetical protein